MENLRSGSALRLNEHVLAKGEIVPLRSGDVLQLGHLCYEVSLEPARA